MTVKMSHQRNTDFSFTVEGQVIKLCQPTADPVCRGLMFVCNIKRGMDPRGQMLFNHLRPLAVVERSACGIQPGTLWPACLPQLSVSFKIDSNILLLGFKS